MSEAPVSIPSPIRWRMLVASHDGNKDLWPYFFHFLDQHWPQAPAPTYLISNYTAFDSPGVKTIAIGPDRAWSDNIRSALNAIEEDYVLLILDDMFLCSDVNMDHFGQILDEFLAQDGLFCELHVRRHLDALPGTMWLRNIPDKPLTAGINCGFWKKEFLMQACAPGKSIWEVDTETRRLNQIHRSRMFYINESKPRGIDYVESVRGGFWKPEGIEYLQKSNLTPDLWIRPYPPQGRDWISRNYRSFLKRRMQFQRWRSAGDRTPVRPLSSS